MLQSKRFHRRYAVTHPKYGIFLGHSSAGIACWSTGKTYGNFHCFVFDTPQQAFAHMLGFEGGCTLATEIQVEVVNTFQEHFANVVELEEAGLSKNLVGDMRATLNRIANNAPIAGHA